MISQLCMAVTKQKLKDVTSATRYSEPDSTFGKKKKRETNKYLQRFHLREMR